MTTAAFYIRHVFGGGWAQDFGPTVDVSPDQSGRLVLPFLLEADNVIYEFDGGPHKVPGTQKLNAAALAQNRFDVSNEDLTPTGIAFKTDGAKLFIAGQDDNEVHEYSLDTEWDLSTTNAVTTSFDVTSEDIVPRGIDFKTDGTKLYMVGNSSDKVHQYPLSGAWDLTTAGAVEASFDISGEDTIPTGVRLKSDGTKLYITGAQNDQIRQYPLSTPWDLSSGGAVEASFNASGEDDQPAGLFFKSDGTKMYFVGQTNLKVFQYPLSTAWDISSAGAVEASLDITNEETIPWDIAFEDDGTTLFLIGGAKNEVRAYNLSTAWDISTASVDAGATIKGIFDAWFSGTAGTAAQHRIANVGAIITRDDGDGQFTTLFTDLTAGAIPAYAMMEDILVMSNSVDVPKSWDGTTAQNLAGSPPTFAFAAVHKNRMWAAGDDSQPSRLYYSALLNPEDWVGAGSGTIDSDPDDGDRITGIISHKNELWVFKGPYKGSIHRITGSAPTGDDAFARRTFINGIGAVGHNTLFRFRDDIGFMWSDGTVHSLEATASFGDFNEAALSRPINSWLREHLTFNRLEHAWAATWDEFGIVLFAVPHDTATDPSIVLMMDYRFQPARWAPWPAFNTEVAACIGSVVDSGNNNRRIIMGGGSDGFIRKFGQSTRSIDGVTALSFKVTTPYLNYGRPSHMKTIYDAGIAIQPKNAGTFTFGWTRDTSTQQTENVSQGGVDVLGPASANQFTLGTSTLGGARFVDRFVDLVEGGEFRSISYEISNATNNEDIEIHAIAASVKEGARSLEN